MENVGKIRIYLLDTVKLNESLNLKSNKDEKSGDKRCTQVLPKIPPTRVTFADVFSLLIVEIALRFLKVLKREK